MSATAGLTSNQKAVITLGSAVLGVLLARRWLRHRALGDAVLGPVTVTSTSYDDEDRRQEALSSQYRAAMALLQMDLDLMEPTHHPSPNEALLLEQTARNLEAAGRADDAHFLRELLHEAVALPLPGTVVDEEGEA